MPKRAQKYKKAPKGYKLSKEGFCYRWPGFSLLFEEDNKPVFSSGDVATIDSPNSRLHRCRVKILWLSSKTDSNISRWSYRYEVLLLSRTKAVLDFFKCIGHRPKDEYITEESEDSLMYKNGLTMLVTKLCSISKTKSNESEI